MTTAQYTITKRGQIIKVIGDRCLIVIEKAQPQVGGPPTVGLSDALLEWADKNKKTIYVKLQWPSCEFKTTAKDWIKGAKKEEQKSYYNIPWYVYRKAIPKKPEEVNLPEKSEEEKQREWFYKKFVQR